MSGFPALVRALLVWLLVILAESLSGALRRFLFDPQVEFAARQVSVVVGVLIVFAITWIFGRWMRPGGGRAAIGVGLIWVALTLAFEIGLGRATGVSWTRLASDYDLTHGGLMPLGLLAMALTPWAVLRLQARRKAATARTTAGSETDP